MLKQTLALESEEKIYWELLSHFQILLCVFSSQYFQYYSDVSQSRHQFFRCFLEPPLLGYCFIFSKQSGQYHLPLGGFSGAIPTHSQWYHSYGQFFESHATMTPNATWKNKISNLLLNQNLFQALAFSMFLQLC